MTDAVTIFRDGLLDGRKIVVSGGTDGRYLTGVIELSEQLGAAVVDPDGDLDSCDLLLIDASASWQDLLDPLEGAWAVTRPLVNEHFIPGGGGKLVFIASPATADGAGALRAAFENLARTLSIEWARYNIRTATILPGVGTEADQVATLVAYLASDAGDYFSGCRFELS